MAFVLVDSEYDRIPDFLLSNVQGFSDSIEYERLSHTARKLPGIVCAAFSRFLVRFQEQELLSGLSERDAKTLEDCYRVIEELSHSNDERIRTALKEEIFENLDCGKECWTLIGSKLGRSARRVFDEAWSDSEPT